MNAAASLECVAPGRPLAVLLRHAERGPISNPTKGHDVPLTADGEKSSADLGRVLARFSRVRAFHSPVPRCEQTAQHVVAGASEAGIDARVMGPLGALGGPYLRQSQRALEMARDMASDFVRAWFDGRLPKEMIESRENAARGQLKLCIDVLAGEAEPGAFVFVTHDWNLLLVREQYFGIRHEEAGWPCFLDAILVFRDDDSLRLRYGDAEASMPAIEE